MPSSDLTHTFEINGRSYICEPHGAMDGLEVIDLLIRAGAGGIVSALFGAINIDPDGKSEVSAEAVMAAVDPEAVGAALSSGLASIGGISKMAPLILKHTSIVGYGKLNTRVALDNAFARRYGDLAKVVSEVMTYNGFFELLLGFFSDESEQSGKPSDAS